MVLPRTLRRVGVVVVLALLWVVAEPGWTQAVPAVYEQFRGLVADDGVVVPV